jgi:membrane protease YdiL (CAAX protease family)
MQHIYSSITYLALGLSILSLWVASSRYVWLWLLSIATIFGLESGRISFIGLLEVVEFGSLVYLSYRKKTSKILRLISIISAAAMASGLYYHYLPGFDNWRVLSKVKFSEDSVPYSLYLNFDKTIIGLFILAFGFTLKDFKNHWKATLRLSFPIIAFGLLTILLLAFATAYITFDPKFPKITWIWALTNLFFVCTAEEAIFRGAIQKNLTIWLKKYKYGSYASLVIASLLFGLSHFWGGASYVFLASVAGLFYGYAYMRTNRIESSIIFHFTLNFIHFTLFSYPALLRIEFY